MSLDGVLVLIGDMVVVRLMRTLSCNGPNDDSGSDIILPKFWLYFLNYLSKVHDRVMGIKLKCRFLLGLQEA